MYEMKCQLETSNSFNFMLEFKNLLDLDAKGPGKQGGGIVLIPL